MAERVTADVNGADGAEPAKVASPNAAVVLSSVTRVFGLAPGIVRVDLLVAPGELLLIRGPNGSGKTTSLRVIGTAISPTSGSGSVGRVGGRFGLGPRRPVG